MGREGMGRREGPREGRPREGRPRNHSPDGFLATFLTAHHMPLGQGFRHQCDSPKAVRGGASLLSQASRRLLAQVQRPTGAQTQRRTGAEVHRPTDAQVPGPSPPSEAEILLLVT